MTSSAQTDASKPILKCLPPKAVTEAGESASQFYDDKMDILWTTKDPKDNLLPMMWGPLTEEQGSSLN